MTRASGVERARDTLEEALHRFDPRDVDSVLRAERACIGAEATAENFFGASTAAYLEFCAPIREAWTRIREARADLFGAETELTDSEKAELLRWLEGRDAAQANTFIERLKEWERNGLGVGRGSLSYIEFEIEQRSAYVTARNPGRAFAGFPDRCRLRQEPEVLRAAQRYVRRWVVEQLARENRNAARLFIPSGMRVVMESFVTRQQADLYAETVARPSPQETRTAAQILAEIAQFGGLGVSAEQAARALRAMGQHGPSRFTKEAKHRARELLLSRLTEEQRKTFEDAGHFDLRSQRGNSYRVEAKSQINVTCVEVEKVLDAQARPRRNHRYCLTVPGVPLDDQLLAQKILLESDEAGFHAKAIDHGPAYQAAADYVRSWNEDLARGLFDAGAPLSPGRAIQTIEFTGMGLRDLRPGARVVSNGRGGIREARPEERPLGVIDSIVVERGGHAGAWEPSCTATVRVLEPISAADAVRLAQGPPYIAIEMDPEGRPGEFTEMDAVTTLDWRDETVVECRARDLLSVNQPVTSAGDGTLRAAEEGERALGVVTAVETRPGEELHRIQVLMGPPLMQARRPLRQLVPSRREPPVPDPGPVDNWPRWLGRLRAWNADPGVQRIAGIIRGDAT